MKISLLMFTWCMQLHQMNLINNWHRLAKNSKFAREISKLHASCYRSVNEHPNGLQTQTTLLEHAVFARNVAWRSNLPCCSEGNFLRSNLSAISISRQFGQSASGDPQMDRDFLVQLWIADRKATGSRGKRKRKAVKNGVNSETVYGNKLSTQLPFGRWFSGASLTEENPYEQEKPVLKQPPPSQSVTDFLEPASLEEVKLNLWFASK